MGLEIKTVAVKGAKKFSGKLHLDSRELKFSSPEFKWSIPLGDGIKAIAKKTKLIVSKGRDKVTFEIGERPERWVDKILNPPSRLDKLGVKPGMKCWLSKGFESEFKTELKSQEAKITRQIDNCDLAFFSIDDRKNFGSLLECCDAMPGATNIWVVYPKGSNAITQGEVMGTLKKAGFGPSKTASFDEQLSSMRYKRKLGR